MALNPLSVSKSIQMVPSHPSQAAELFNIMNKNRKFLRQWLPWLDFNTELDDTRAFLEECDWKNQSGEAMQFAIFENAQLVGMLGTHKVDKLNHQSSLGYWLAERAQGRGILTQSCQKFLDFLFESQHLHRIEIRCAVGNQKSESVAVRLGFQCEGIARQSEWLYDHFVDLKIYALLKPEWEERSDSASRSQP